jgi:hypothetical protein
MYYMGATGVLSSVRSQNSGRSLLTTLLTNAWVVFIRYVLLGAPLGLLLAGVIIVQVRWSSWSGMSTARIATMFLMVSAGLTVVSLFAEAELQLCQAEQWLLENERINQS